MNLYTDWTWGQGAQAVSNQRPLAFLVNIVSAVWLFKINFKLLIHWEYQTNRDKNKSFDLNKYLLRDQWTTKRFIQMSKKNAELNALRAENKKLKSELESLKLKAKVIFRFFSQIQKSVSQFKVTILLRKIILLI